MPQYADTRKEYLKPLRSFQMVRQLRAAIGHFPNRTNVIAEGDSWFGYPPEWLIVGDKANILDHMEYLEHFNMLRLERFGAHADKMLRGRSKRRLSWAMRTAGDRLDYLLFSGGGNDILDPKVFPKILQKPPAGGDAAACLKMEVLEKELEEVREAYLTLLEMRDKHCPNATVVTHTYDYIAPTGKPAVLAGGIIKEGPWLKDKMITAKIPVALREGVLRLMLDRFAAMLRELPEEGFVVVNTFKTLKPGVEEDWLNEIHPTSSGFGKIARKIYEKGMC